MADLRTQSSHRRVPARPNAPSKLCRFHEGVKPWAHAAKVSSEQEAIALRRHEASRQLLLAHGNALQVLLWRPIFVPTAPKPRQRLELPEILLPDESTSPVNDHIFVFEDPRQMLQSLVQSHGGGETAALAREARIGYGELGVNLRTCATCRWLQEDAPGRIPVAERCTIADDIKVSLEAEECRRPLQRALQPQLNRHLAARKKKACFVHAGGEQRLRNPWPGAPLAQQGRAAHGLPA
mmetsp:Transcript_77447/g.201532  ORF Transcript_77447/g.201532 Transcript_77447/m.201532 type:complete len:238 (-) Transcript_77447:2-715(-)